MELRGGTTKLEKPVNGIEGWDREIGKASEWNSQAEMQSGLKPTGEWGWMLKSFVGMCNVA